MSFGEIKDRFIKVNKRKCVVSRLQKGKIYVIIYCNYTIGYIYFNNTISLVTEIRSYNT